MCKKGKTADSVNKRRFLHMNTKTLSRSYSFQINYVFHKLLFVTLKSFPLYDIFPQFKRCWLYPQNVDCVKKANKNISFTIAS